jgi:hypothetical protein
MVGRPFAFVAGALGGVIASDHLASDFWFRSSVTSRRIIELQSTLPGTQPIALIERPDKPAVVKVLPDVDGTVQRARTLADTWPKILDEKKQKLTEFVNSLKK